MFTLEALEAKHGDALLLHYGTKSEPRLVVIDGGPAGVYGGRLKPRLLDLKASRSPDAPLRIELLMVSHIDDDHIKGVLDLAEDLVELQEDQQELTFDIQTLWHNSFEDLTGADPADLASTTKAVRPVALGERPPAGLAVTQRGALILASVGQGRTLRNQADALGLAIPGLVTFEGGAAKAIRVAPGLTLQILGPNANRVAALKQEWIKKLKQKAKASETEWRKLAADYVDNAVANLSSIVALARHGKRSMLLTGDARGDDILAALTQAKLFKQGRLHVDLLKVPHHGSDRNVATDFFRKVTADHYVISADGRFDNPEVATLKMIAEARGNSKYTVHLTNAVRRIDNFLKRQKTAGGKAASVVRDPKASSIRVDLEDPLID